MNRNISANDHDVKDNENVIIKTMSPLKDFIKNQWRLQIAGGKTHSTYWKSFFVVEFYRSEVRLQVRGQVLL